MMDRETTIDYMKRAVTCNQMDYSFCKDKNCYDCQYDYPVMIIDVVKSALKLLEAEEEDE